MTVGRLLRDNSAASAAEFALVLPLLLIMLFAVVDGGRYMWTYNRAEKATQMGARFAVVANPIASGLATSYVGVSGLTQGDLIPASAFGKITCTSTTCTCTTNPCPAIGTVTTQNFTNIVNRMQLFMPEIQPSNVQVEYSSSGLGYAGNPGGADLSPLVTVRLTGLTFQPITALTLATVTMPDFHTTLSAEDLSGSQSN